MTVRRSIVALSVTALLSAGCTTRMEVHSSPAPTPAPFQANIDLSSFGGDCQKVKCWLPTQFRPKLVKGESVSLKETPKRHGWPMDGDAVWVVCVAKGGSYHNGSGQSVNDWYGIRVPSNKMADGAWQHALTTSPGKAQFVGFVGASWIKGGEGKQAPPCQLP